MINSINDSSASTTSAVIVVLSDSESEIPTFVHVGSENEQESDKQADNSPSIDGSSMWEHIERDSNFDENNKSPVSDGTSDTFASASLQNSQTGGNTDMMTPDESNGISFEEDSQPITLHKPDGNRSENATDRRNSTSSSLLEIDSNEKNESNKYVADFVERYVFDAKVDSNGVSKPMLKSVPRSKSEENVLLEQGREAINMQNIPNKIYKAVETAANTVANTFNAITMPATITNGYTTDDVNFSPNRLDSVTEKNPLEEFQFQIPRDPFMSPYYASDEMLRQMPPVKILVSDKIRKRPH